MKEKKNSRNINNITEQSIRGVIIKFSLRVGGFRGLKLSVMGQA